nr:ferritin heavy chain B-like [Pelodiscus sinensis]|eukprot:XP_014428028.1 ferritin heavy chain B-like [Pelodiscus sinensis]
MGLCNSFVYLSMSCSFDHDDMALRHTAQFLEKSYEARKHAERFLSCQKTKGVEGGIVMQDIKKPEQDEWANSLEALQCVLKPVNSFGLGM